MRNFRIVLAALVLLSGLPAAAHAGSGGSYPEFDFVVETGPHGWVAAHDVAPLEAVEDGLKVAITGGDPYIHGPSRDYPEGKLLWLNVRLRSDQGGVCQVFYFKHTPVEGMSVRFPVPPGEWHSAKVPIPALGPGYHLRIDPPGNAGDCVLGRVWVEQRVIIAAPNWPAPSIPEVGTGAVTAKSGSLRVRHNRQEWGGFWIEWDGKRLGIGNNAAMVGYVIDDKPRWFRMNPGQGSQEEQDQDRDQDPGPDPDRKRSLALDHALATNPPLSVRSVGRGLLVKHSVIDPDGATWSFDQRFTPREAGSISVETSVQVNSDRQVIYLPVFTQVSGVGTVGTNKHQALFAGLEYLENEPSSSEADLEGAASWRLAPDTIKSTIPLMAVEEGGRYLSLIWTPQPGLCAVFDSPDRQFKSGGHLMGLLFPGSNGGNREENALLPYYPETLKAGVVLKAEATIAAGEGGSVASAVQQYVKLHPLPALPGLGMKPSDYYDLAAHGWLDSRIRETNLYRHAFWPGFEPQPAADAAVWMRWLADRGSLAASLRFRLEEAAVAALTRVSPANYNAAQVSHIRFPLPALIFGAVPENVAQARQAARDALGRFQPDGTILYQARPGAADYGRTHWTKHANGLTAVAVMSLLEGAAYCGDPEIIQRALAQLRLLDQYHGTVPRGAQTWEIPLHTPDILASAHLVKAYVLGFELSGDRHFLEEAIYWGWTGVPFVYLHPPTERPVGLYATIPVLGATAWKAPVWLGLPVQWCGLVYADALYRLAAYDARGPWRQLAEGITISGIQQSWPKTDQARQGLLPDFFQLRPQLSDGPAINPGTVQACAVRYLPGPRAYDFRFFTRNQVGVHAPGEISDAKDSKDRVSFKVQPCSSRDSWILVNGLRSGPRLKIDGRSVPLQSPHQFVPGEGILVLKLEREKLVEVGVEPGQH